MFYKLNFQSLWSQCLQSVKYKSLCWVDWTWWWSSLVSSSMNLILRLVWVRSWSKSHNQKAKNCFRKYVPPVNILLPFMCFIFQHFLFLFAAILTPTDEFQFWIECARHGTKLYSKERASHFKDLFEDIAKVCFLLCNKWCICRL